MPSVLFGLACLLIFAVSQAVRDSFFGNVFQLEADPFLPTRAPRSALPLTPVFDDSEGLHLRGMAGAVEGRMLARRRLGLRS